ncbi:pantoate--beta-alanine ligase [Candidatus Saganbacteria bacterium]|nr:pantoate--beta-alanine ligase [Candidatus Saganbacteria bacterium]
MKAIKSPKEMSLFSKRTCERGQKIALVPTMGSLHEGHLSLVEKARSLADMVVVSIFVNKTQFAPNEDYNSYPRDLNRDKALLKHLDPIVLFTPSASDMYHPDFGTWVEEEVLCKKLCGKFRMGHFMGVTTVVAKLFNIVRPDLAIFGEKDYQQLLIIKKLAKDLSYPVEIHSCPTVREYDGIAMSSRNQYLSEKDRKSATMLYKSLIRAKKDIEDGEIDSRRIIVNIGRLLGFEPSIRVDYTAIVDPHTLEDIKEVKGRVLAALAVRIGKTRLIDNMMISPK